MEQELVTIPKQNAMQVFTSENALEPYLARIRKEIDQYLTNPPSIETAAGRKAIGSMAFKVAKSRTYLEAVGKGLADEAKSIPKKIDASRKHVRDTLEMWQEEVRKPLTEWELAEEARVVRHTAALDRINALKLAVDVLGVPIDAATLRDRLAEVEAVTIGLECEEFETEYARAKDWAAKDLRAAIAAREEAEAEQAELARLRQEATQRAAMEREEQIRREAAARATKEAEDRAKAEREAGECRELELRLTAEEAERRALEAEKATVLRLAREREAEEAAAAKREANKRHRATINNAAVAAFVAGGLSEGAAKAAVTLIAQKTIPAVTINY